MFVAGRKEQAEGGEPTMLGGRERLLEQSARAAQGGEHGPFILSGSFQRGMYVKIIRGAFQGPQTEAALSTLNRGLWDEPAENGRGEGA